MVLGEGTVTIVETGAVIPINKDIDVDWALLRAPLGNTFIIRVGSVRLTKDRGYALIPGNTIKIMQFELTVAISFGQSFIGCWRGWSDARIDMSADAAFTATVAIGYVKIPKISTLKYSEWDKLR